MLIGDLIREKDMVSRDFAEIFKTGFHPEDVRQVLVEKRKKHTDYLMKCAEGYKHAVDNGEASSSSGDDYYRSYRTLGYMPEAVEQLAKVQDALTYLESRFFHKNGNLGRDELIYMNPNKPLIEEEVLAAIKDMPHLSNYLKEQAEHSQQATHGGAPMHD